jgi:hypothetical protein
MRSFTPALVLLLALPALPAAGATATPRASMYVLRVDPGAPLRRGALNSGYGGGADVTWPIPRSQGLLAVFGGAEAASLLSRTYTLVDTTSGDHAEHHMDQLYGRFYAGAEMGPHADGTLEPYANFAFSSIVYGYYDDVQLTTGGKHEELLVAQHEVGVGWAAGAGMNLNFRSFGITGGVRYLRQFGTPRQLGNGTVAIQPAYMQYRLGVTMPFPVEAGGGQ